MSSLRALLGLPTKASPIFCTVAPLLVAAQPGPHPFCRADPAAKLDGCDPDTQRLAPIFDGQLDPLQRLQRAQEQFGKIDAAQLAAAQMDLTLAGFLEPGVREPLPSPGQIERDPWGRLLHPERRETVQLPGLLPGTLAQPGLPGAIAGNFGGGHRGWEDAVRHPLSPRFFSAIGRALSAPIAHTWLGWLVVGLVIVGILEMWNVHFQVERVGLRLLRFDHLVVVLAIASLMNNIGANSARLAAIHRATGRWPGFGLVLSLRVIPKLFTSTSGAAEDADNRGRSQILLAPMMALLVLTLLGQFGWFLTRLGPGVLPQYFLGQAGCSLIYLLISANPLARRDGYHWLTDRLGVPDLREQSRMSLFGRNRAWNLRPTPPLSVRWIYAGATIAYLLTVVTLYVLFPAHLLVRRLGGVGVVVVLTSFSINTYLRTRRELYMRSSLEPFRLKFPTLSRTWWIVIGVAIAVIFLPYPYEPSGAAVMLPRDRAEVRALVAGEVKQVLVQEGDLVEADQELLVISDVQTKASVASAEADLKHAQSELAIVKTGGASNEVKLAREKLETARKRHEFAQAEADRLQQAFKRKAVAPQTYDTARGEAEVREQEVAEAEQEVKVIGNPGREERIAALQAEVGKAQSELDYFKEQLANTHVHAPIAGRVVSDKLLFARGTYLTIGAQIGYIEDTDRLQAEIKLPEGTVGDIVEGAKAWVRVWAFPNSSFKGHVIKIAPDAETGEYGKVVRLRVLLDNPPKELKPEMTGEAKVRSHWTLAGLAFTHALIRFFMVEVWSWLP